MSTKRGKLGMVKKDAVESFHERLKALDELSELAQEMGDYHVSDEAKAKMKAGGWHNAIPPEEAFVYEPTDEQVKAHMQETGKSHYAAREELREAAYKDKHSKPDNMDWGTYWKTY